VGILAILLAITLIALNPAKHFQSTRNAQRTSDVTAILNAVYHYQAANKGSLPPSVNSIASVTTFALTNDTDVTDRVDLCADLVSAYIADLPIDPGTGSKDAVTACASTEYNTGYTLQKSATGRFTVSAPGAEDSANIAVTR
jgi:type IV pilus assembly protein PilA